VSLTVDGPNGPSHVAIPVGDYPHFQAHHRLPSSVHIFTQVRALATFHQPPSYQSRSGIAANTVSRLEDWTLSKKTSFARAMSKTKITRYGFPNHLAILVPCHLLRQATTILNTCLSRTASSSYKSSVSASRARHIHFELTFASVPVDHHDGFSENLPHPAMPSNHCLECASHCEIDPQLQQSSKAQPTDYYPSF
jgi:hypothetical protein